MAGLNIFMAASLDANAVAAALQSVLSATDNSTRQNAEQVLGEMAIVEGAAVYMTRDCESTNSDNRFRFGHQTGFPVCLAEIARTANAPVHLRLSAAVNLKNFVAKSWSSREFGFVGTEPGAEAKAFIKAVVLAGLSDSESRIRVLMAAIATKIANIEDLESWPELFTSLMANLQSGGAEQIHGALRVISSFVDDISETQFSQIAPVLLPQVYEIFANEAFNPRIRSRAVSVFRKFLTTLKNVEKVIPNVVSQYLEPQLPSWMSSFHAILAPMHLSNEQIIFKTEIFYTIEFLASDFPIPMKAYLPETIPIVWRTASALFPIYSSTSIVANDHIDAAEEVDTDGDVQGIQSLFVEDFIVGEEKKLTSRMMDVIFARGRTTEKYVRVRSDHDDKHGHRNSNNDSNARRLQSRSTEDNSWREAGTNTLHTPSFDRLKTSNLRLSNLLTAIVYRLATAKYTQLIETLILVFANLILQHGSATIVDFLSGISVPERNLNGLELLLTVWADHFGEVNGFYNVKLNAAAMATLFKHSGSDERVQKVIVKGRLKPTEKIITRSKSKNVPDQYTMIPFPAKAVMVLLTDYQQNRESAMKGDKGGMAADEFTGETADSEDGEEWDDLDDEAGVDAVGFGEDWGDNDEEEDTTDPELINKDVYDLNMTEYLSSFIISCAANNVSNFSNIADQILDSGEKKILGSILSQK
ncbi:Importin 9 [Chytriomyces hyalinus]|nr:Importin 9 [Chytriomyces hyalinus]